MDKKPSANAEDLARKLQEKLRHERPQWLRWVPLLAVVLLGTMGIIAWLLYPEPDPPRLTVTVLDTLAVAGEPVSVRAYLDPVDPDAKSSSLAGWEAVFAMEHGAADGGQARPKAVSDEHGKLSAAFDAGAKGTLSCQIRQVVVAKSKNAPKEDRAQVFAWDKNSPLLLVDVEETLADLDAKSWSKTNAHDIGVRAGAAAALQAAHAKHKFTIVYLAIVNAPAKEYRKTRGWIDLKTKMTAVQALPNGPVLGRLGYEAGSDRDARQSLLADLRQRFTGPIVAVVRTSDAAEQCQKLDIRPIAMGGGDFPERVTRIKSWDELLSALAP